MLEPAEIDRAVAPYTGKSKDFADVQRALEALEDRYRRAGYGTVQVILPEQELERGVIVLRVVEPRVAKITVEGNKFFDAENIRRSIPELKEGVTPNIVAMGQSSRLANENPAKRTTVLLRAGAKEDEIDATIRVKDEKFWRAGVSLDNTGSPTTGMYRLSFAYQHSNLFNLDHTLTFQYQLDPAPLNEIDQLKVMGLAYRIPLYGLKSSIDLLAGYSDIGSASGQVIEGIGFNTSGSGTIFGARYNHTLPRIAAWPDYEHSVSFGLDYKAFTNQVVTVSAPDENLAPDVTVYPFSITYSASRRFENAEISFYGSGAHNIYPHGPDAYREKFYSEEPPYGVRPGVGRPTYTVWRYGLNAVRALANDVQLRANVSGQWSRDALVPGEQFGLGGWESLRGMRERESANDKGYRATLEVYSPDLGGKLGLEGARLRFLTFFDWGDLNQNFKSATVCDNDACGFFASSVGFGMRMSLREGLSFRVDYGRMRNGSAVERKGDDRWHAGLAWAF